MQFIVGFNSAEQNRGQCQVQRRMTAIKGKTVNRAIMRYGSVRVLISVCAR